MGISTDQANLYAPVEQDAMYFVECGNHFSASGPSPTPVYDLFEQHAIVCADRPQDDPPPWWEGATDMVQWGIAAAAIVIMVAMINDHFLW